MAITDLVTIFLSFFLTMRGASRGFMNSLINPFSIIVTTILSIVYYQDTKDLTISLLIGTIGPLLLTFILKFILRSLSWTSTEIQPHLLSRLGGAIITLAWGWVFIVFTLLLLTVLPTSWGMRWVAIHKDVTRSISYSRIALPLRKDLFGVLAAGDPELTKEIAVISSAASKQNDPAVMSTSPNADARSLAEDPRFQKILQDPEIQNEINAHDFVKLMSNPKMLSLTQEIMSDPATMKKVFAIYNSQTTSTLGVEAVTANNSN